MADYPIRTREQAFLAAIAGEGDMPNPKNRKEAILAKAGGADVDIEPKSGNEYWTLMAMQGGGGGAKTVVILPEQTVTIAAHEGPGDYCDATVTLDKEPDPNYDVDVTFDGNALTLQYMHHGYEVSLNSDGKLYLYYDDSKEAWVFGAEPEEAVGAGAHTVKIVQTQGMEPAKHGLFKLVNSSASDLAIKVHVGSYAFARATKNLAPGNTVILPCEYEATGSGRTSRWNASASYACLPEGTASEFSLGPVSGYISSSDVSLINGGLHIHAARANKAGPADELIGTIEIYARA